MLVSNTSTLVLLAKVGCLEEFVKISQKIEIPSQVEEEALFQKESYYAKLIHNFIKTKKIDVVKVEESKVTKIMSEFRLDYGEAATYIMFNDKKHKAILTDDGELIKLCKLQEVPFVCAMAVVIILFEKDILSKKQTFKKLEELNKIGRYSKEIYEYFRMEVK